MKGLLTMWSVGSKLKEVEGDKKLAERIKKIADQYHKTVDTIEDDEGTGPLITMEKMYVILSTVLPSFLGFLMSNTWKQCLKELGAAFMTLASQQISVASVMMILTGGAILRGIVHWNRYLANKNMERIRKILEIEYKNKEVEQPQEGTSRAVVRSSGSI
ncbi:hypothetical protein A2U01_0005660, partial [Trifolium medium]|nr:hypothetical protein [Trifolium medium]